MFVKKSYKPVGKTPKQLLNQLQKEDSKKYFHIGNLDPMAEGLMVFIWDKFRFLEGFLKGFRKEYLFTVIQGFNTDTHDLLGLVRDYDAGVASKEKEVKNVIRKICKSKNQVPPKVSYKNLSSKKKLKKFHEEGVKALPKLAKNKVRCHDITYIGKRSISKKSFFEYLNENINKVEGNFRQTEILNRYYKSKSTLPDKFILYDVKVVVDSGFYIRGLVRDLFQGIETPMTTFSIKRTKIGPFSL